MEVEWLKPYVLPALIAGFFLYRFLKFRRVRSQIPQLIRSGAVVIDVRSRAEYAGGAREGSINIPLDELDRGLEKLNRNQTVILCCASGARSSMASAVLKRKGFQSVINAGSWQNTVTSSL